MFANNGAIQQVIRADAPIECLSSFFLKIMLNAIRRRISIPALDVSLVLGVIRVKDDDAKAKLEHLFEIQDTNELIRQYRIVFAEANGIAEQGLFPFLIILPETW